MRAYCPMCRYPQSTCLCAHIRPLVSPVNIIVLQHPDEVTQAKNTARLLSLCSQQVHIEVGITEQDFSALRQQIDVSQCAVIYPTAASQPLAGEPQRLPSGSTASLIFLDASWRKSRALWHANPWLHDLPQWHFHSPPSSRYRIRHTDRSDSLSTLEAVAYTLDIGYQLDPEPLYQAQEALQSHWRGPAQHLRAGPEKR